MGERKIDITNSIISSLDMQRRINEIIPDFAVLDIQYNFVSVSHSISEATGYSRRELVGESISAFSVSSDFKIPLEDRLQPGYFQELPYEMRCKNGETIRFTISGFYIGLITDINGLIVVRFKNPDETNHIHKKLEAKTEELDNFIYHSAHALRGPLATLKGLINLAHNTTKKEEIDFLVQQMNVFAEKLDDKLHQLIYFAESDKTGEPGVEKLTVHDIFQALLGSVRETSVDFPVNFHCLVVDQKQVFEAGEIILSMLTNMVLFFSQQPKKSGNLLLLDAHSSSYAIEIMICAKGFTFGNSMIEKIRKVNFGYSEILNFPELVNYYAAKKIMLKLNGTIQFMHLASDEVVVLMTIPSDTQLSLF